MWNCAPGHACWTFACGRVEDRCAHFFSLVLTVRKAHRNRVILTLLLSPWVFSVNVWADIAVCCRFEWSGVNSSVSWEIPNQKLCSSSIIFFTVLAVKYLSLCCNSTLDLFYVSCHQKGSGHRAAWPDSSYWEACCNALQPWWDIETGLLTGLCCWLIVFKVSHLSSWLIQLTSIVWKVMHCFWWLTFELESKMQTWCLC